MGERRPHAVGHCLAHVQVIQLIRAYLGRTGDVQLLEGDLLAARGHQMARTSELTKQQAGSTPRAATDHSYGSYEASIGWLDVARFQRREDFAHH
jgi:hypothetical protein